MIDFNIDNFIAECITKRKESLFASDIRANMKQLRTCIEGKTLLVIGGAGSIGSSFIKACLPFKPRSLVVVDINENGLAELTRDLRSTKGLFIPDDYVSYPINYADSVFEKLFRARKGFDIVANFSAHKHVRSEKDIYSIEALLKNNIINAKKLLDLLKKFPPEAFFCVSTDKAANPVNVMGASKRIMEDLIFSYSDYFPVKTARFANVAFSNGSLPAGFLERIAKFQPISAPSDVKRYFVSPKESGEICMLACMLGNNREVYFPKLDQASTMTFSDIAEKLLTTLGYNIYHCSSEEEAKEKALQLFNGSRDYPVYFSTSDTTGEKAYEEFFTQAETVDMTQFAALGVITDIAKRQYTEIDGFISELEQLFNKNSLKKSEIIMLLKRFLPNFAHEEVGRNLDGKM
ncbi:polysaccharide biosynthesis protein [Treponema vincentii]|uniref:polysaccharide biosynthesis protein n=1 Tax=Treponema vincentii TaxID=69710 RepID=UPI0020A4CDFD|nr:polysaccharide biosynthesis protein [Treponema vincentii]UTC48225.1 polysaccharide biosynthesis protein [Treponema vincentii]